MLTPEQIDRIKSIDYHNMSEEEFMELEPCDIELDESTYELLVDLAGGSEDPRHLSKVVSDIVLQMVINEQQISAVVDGESEDTNHTDDTDDKNGP